MVQCCLLSVGLCTCVSGHQSPPLHVCQWSPVTTTARVSVVTTTGCKDPNSLPNFTFTGRAMLSPSVSTAVSIALRTRAATGSISHARTSSTACMHTQQCTALRLQCTCTLYVVHGVNTGVIVYASHSSYIYCTRSHIY